MPITLDDMPRYALVQRHFPEKSLQFLTLSEEDRQALWEEFKDKTNPDTQRMADFLDLTDNWCDVTMYTEKPKGWPEQYEHDTFEVGDWVELNELGKISWDFGHGVGWEDLPRGNRWKVKQVDFGGWPSLKLENSSYYWPMKVFQKSPRQD